jgi:hypothetical protein
MTRPYHAFARCRAAANLHPPSLGEGRRPQAAGRGLIAGDREGFTRPHRREVRPPYENAWSPVISRPTISACTVSVPS